MTVTRIESAAMSPTYVLREPTGPMAVGIDLVQVARIQRLVGNRRAMAMLFTERERSYCEARPRVAEHLAARFAAKEATVKALGTGMRYGVRWPDIEVINDDFGKPEIVLSGAAQRIAEQRGVVSVEVSLTHTDQFAVAHVVVLLNARIAWRDIEMSCAITTRRGEP